MTSSDHRKKKGDRSMIEIFRELDKDSLQQEGMFIVQMPGVQQGLRPRGERLAVPGSKSGLQLPGFCKSHVVSVSIRSVLRFNL